MTQDFPDLDPKDFDVLLPVDVEKQLRYLNREIYDAQKENAQIESEYSYAKAHLEIAMAKTRLEYANKSKPGGKNYTADERTDLAITENEDAVLAVAILEARIKASRGRINKLSLQTDIVRSVSTSVRSSMATER